MAGRELRHADPLHARALAAPATGACVRLLLDEMISPRIARELRDRGHDVQAVKRDRPELAGCSDRELVQCRQRRSRCDQRHSAQTPSEAYEVDVFVGVGSLDQRCYVRGSTRPVDIEVCAAPGEGFSSD
jgi:hypothetical protein